MGTDDACRDSMHDAGIEVTDAAQTRAALEEIGLSADEARLLADYVVLDAGSFVVKARIEVGRYLQNRPEATDVERLGLMMGSIERRFGAVLAVIGCRKLQAHLDRPPGAALFKDANRRGWGQLLQPLVHSMHPAGLINSDDGRAAAAAAFEQHVRDNPSYAASAAALTSNGERLHAENQALQAAWNMMKPMGPNVLLTFPCGDPDDPRGIEADVSAALTASKLPAALLVSCDGEVAFDAAFYGLKAFVWVSGGGRVLVCQPARIAARYGMELCPQLSLIGGQQQQQQQARRRSAAPPRKQRRRQPPAK